MKKIALTFVAVAAATLLWGTAVSNAQDRESSHAGVAQMEGMHQGSGQHKGDGDRDHRHHGPVVVVGVPVFVGPAYAPYSYYLAPPMDAYRTLDGFYYFCPEFAGFYPAVEDCPNGWRLVP